MLRLLSECFLIDAAVVADGKRDAITASVDTSMSASRDDEHADSDRARTDAHVDDESVEWRATMRAVAHAAAQTAAVAPRLCAQQRVAVADDVHVLTRLESSQAPVDEAGVSTTTASANRRSRAHNVTVQVCVFVCAARHHCQHHSTMKATCRCAPASTPTRATRRDTVALGSVTSVSRVRAHV
jgi:hypothetical protein